MNNRYGTLASWVYNLDKPVGRSFGDVEYYLERLAGSGPVLEPAVGNGRFFVPMLEAGFDIWGFDPSEEMLDYCRAACAERSLDVARVSRGTFEDFSHERRFAAIVVPLGSFQLITDMAAARSALRRFFEHLEPEGRLMIDLDAIEGFLGEGGRVRSWTTGDGDLLTLTDTRASTDYVAQTTVTHLRYELWKGTKLADTEMELFSLRWWGVEEFAMALREAGFTDVVASADYRYGQAPTKGCGTISFEARRPK
ncbi:class I SAM-dependent methyltransferase [Aminobacter aganoensis]|uniref:SAM-dependent methyltransferase n=1 Tax=Aminobacter aganoensis TaxID=83264 RepID=A0A7X0KI84_9HYPH|nr:class I SAM-dependent methyltransferase [Aminobacter aganoensis]MBB6352456.1 SAM-dependent methyltransferase [Aminobacter aganoensis]